MAIGFFNGNDFEKRWDEIVVEEDETVDPEIGAASVDLHLGSEYFGSWEVTRGHLSDSARYLSIPPGQFALLTTLEKIAIPPDCLGLLTMRFTWKGRGLLNVSGFHVDPGFRGRLVYAVYNVSNRAVTLEYRESVFTIFVAGLTGDASNRNITRKEQDRIPQEFIDHLSGPSINLIDLNQRVEDLQSRINLFTGLGVGLLIPLLMAAGFFVLDRLV